MVLIMGISVARDPIYAQEHQYEETSPAKGFVVIAHPSVPADQLSRQELHDLYHLEWNRWEDGSLVVLLDMKKEGPARDIFYEYLGRSGREVKRIWMRAVLSGEGQAPKIVRDEEDMLKRVSTTPGAIGYLPLDLVTTQVKVLIQLDDTHSVATEKQPGG